MLEAVGFQTRDLLEAMKADWKGLPDDTGLRVDGGMAASDYTMQFLADITARPVDRPTTLETTAKGAAWLAGMKAGVYPDQETFAKTWEVEYRFEPAMTAGTRAHRLDVWKDAVKRTLVS